MNKKIKLNPKALQDLRARADMVARAFLRGVAETTAAVNAGDKTNRNRPK